MDATGAPAGRVLIGASGVDHEVATHDPALRDLLARAETAAGRDGSARIEADGWVVIAEPLRLDGGGSLAVAIPACSAGTEDERLLSYLTAQAAAALQVIDLHEQLRRQATVDELTGLANQRSFRESLGKAIAHAHRSGEPLSLVLVDVDNFKRVNDTHRHQCGDAVLRGLGGVLRERTRAADMPARYGGEELAVIMPATDTAGACVSAEELRAAVGRITVEGRDGPVRVTASFGVAELGPEVQDAEALVAAADAALYAAKRCGKDRVIADRPTTTVS